MKLRISVTKEILEKSKMCASDGKAIGKNCAIALAVRYPFPNAYVNGDCMWFDENYRDVVELPLSAQLFINTFDKYKPDERVKMQPISFEIEVPDEVTNRINIDEIEKVLQNHPTLQLV